MEKTQEEALKRALVLLKAAGVEYAIRTNDGQTYGTLLIADPKPVKSKRVGSGIPKEVWAGYRSLLKQMQPGDCQRFAVGPYSVEAIRSGITGNCNHMWGTGSYISTVHKDSNEVEILRVE